MFQSPEWRGLGDACNKEMSETSVGTSLNKTMPHCLWTQVDTCKEDEASLCIAMRPTYELSSGTQPSLLLQECSTHFYVGKGNPYPHLCTHYFWIFHVLCFNFSHFSCLLFIFVINAFDMCVFGKGCYTVKAFLPFDALFMHFSLSHPRCWCVSCESF